VAGVSYVPVSSAPLVATVTVTLVTDKYANLCEISGLGRESDAGLTIHLLPLRPAIMCRPESVELVLQFLVDVAFSTGDLLQRLADVGRQPLQLAACVFHT